MRQKHGKYGIGMGVAVVAIALGGAALLPGCTMTSEECVCTDDFRSFYAVVVDGSGALVDGPSSKTILLSDGKEILARPDTTWVPEKGRVTIFSDNNLRDIPNGIISVDVRVTVTKGGKSVSGEYKMATDDCRCHISKAAGPDTLVLR